MTVVRIEGSKCRQEILDAELWSRRLLLFTLPIVEESIYFDSFPCLRNWIQISARAWVDAMFKVKGIKVRVWNSPANQNCTRWEHGQMVRSRGWHENENRARFCVHHSFSSIQVRIKIPVVKDTKQKTTERMVRTWNQHLTYSKVF